MLAEHGNADGEPGRSRKIVLLINPARKTTWSLGLTPRFLPLPLLALASTLVDSYDVLILDRTVDPDDGKLIKILDKSDVICVGVTVLTGPMILDAIYCCNLIRMRRPEIPIVWGGWHVRGAPQSVLGSGFVDYVIRGDAEISFRAFIDHIGAPSTLRDIPGIGFLDGKDIKLNPWSPVDLQTLPKLPMALIENIEPYIRYNTVRGSSRDIVWESSRGCPYACSFCEVQEAYGSSYSCRAPRQMVDDVIMLRDTYGIRGIRYVDSNFFVRLDRVRQFSQTLLDEGVALKWGADGTIMQFRNVSKEDLVLFYRAGLRLVNFGVESGNENFRKTRLYKKFSNADVYTVRSRFDEVEIEFKFNMITGFPGEATEEYMDTVALAVDLATSSQNSSIGGRINIYMPLPGTDMQRRAVAHGYSEPDTLEGYAEIEISKATSQPWLKAGKRRILEVISIMSMFLTVPGNRIPFVGLKKLIFQIIKAIYIFRFRRKIFSYSPDIWLLGKML
jgi:radical SAM superfamily enzyme YgiQ (UPF0313 family)